MSAPPLYSQSSSGRQRCWKHRPLESRGRPPNRTHERLFTGLLAENQYDQCQVPVHGKAIESHLAPHSDSQAVPLARSLLPAIPLGAPVFRKGFARRGRPRTIESEEAGPRALPCLVSDRRSGRPGRMKNVRPVFASMALSTARPHVLPYCAATCISSGIGGVTMHERSRNAQVEAWHHPSGCSYRRCGRVRPKREWLVRRHSLGPQRRGGSQRQGCAEE